MNGSMGGGMSGGMGGSRGMGVGGTAMGGMSGGMPLRIATPHGLSMYGHASMRFDPQHASAWKPLQMGRCFGDGLWHRL